MSASKSLFDLSQEYDAMLNQGLRLSGEDKQFFANGRLQDLHYCLSPSYRPVRILDFGCGIGDTTRMLADLYPEAEVIGVDTADSALHHAILTHGSNRIMFRLVEDFHETDCIDLCYTNGVFHHIVPAERHGALNKIRQALRPGGYFAMFENNPWNPGTRMVMRRIPFDHDAQVLSFPLTRRLLTEAGFEKLLPTRFLFFFPRSLAFLRFLEPNLARLPLGAQYYVLARK